MTTWRRFDLFATFVFLVLLGFVFGIGIGESRSAQNPNPASECQPTIENQRGEP